MILRRIISTGKSAAISALRYSGALSALADRRLDKAVTVLTYHRVIDASRMDRVHSHPGIIVRDTTFDRHMQVLRNEFNPVSLQQFRDSLVRGEQLPPRSCLVTFDDGWLDNFEIALPILSKHGIPATIFLPVYYISNDVMFWQDEVLMKLCWLIDSGNAASHAHLFRELGIDCTNQVPASADIRQFIGTLKSDDNSRIDNVLSLVRQATGDFSMPHYNKYVSWEQVAQMQEAGIEFASHSMSHRILTKLSPERCEFELHESRQILQQKLGRTVDALAYPNGDHDDAVTKRASAAGYVLGFTTRTGIFEPGNDPLAIPRQNIHEGNSSSEARFIARCLNLA